MMITAMYLRKSRAEESEPIEETLSRHRETLTKYASDHKLIVIAQYEEVASGDSLYARPQMLKLLEELERYEAILCMDIDRLGRGAMQEQGLIFDAIKNAGVQIITPAKTYDLTDDMDDSLISFKALFAREEYKMIRGRLRRGALKTIEEGGYLSNAPYGYRQVRVNKKPTLAIDEHEADAVRMVFDFYMQGMGCQAIGDRLHALGYKPHRGDHFNRTSIAKMIRNPVYIGKVVWNQYRFERPKLPGGKHVKRLKPREEWTVTDGLHPAIVSVEKFEGANRRLSGRYHPPFRRPDTLENPLAGVLYCANCGKAMVRQPLYKKPHAQPIMLCQTSGCCMASNMDAVEQAFFATLQDALKEFQLLPPEASAEATEADSVEQAKAEQSRLRSQLNKLHDLLEQGIYDSDTFLARRDELTKRMNATAALLKKTKKAPSTEVIIRNITSVLDAYWDGSPNERNQTIKKAVAKAVYKKPKGSGYNSMPTVEIVEWRA